MLDRQQFLRRGCGVTVATTLGGLITATSAEASRAGPPPYFSDNPFFPQAHNLFITGADPLAAIDFAQKLDPLAVLPVAGLFAQFADDPRALPASFDPIAPLGAANALAYVAQDQQAQVCGKNKTGAPRVRLFEVTKATRLPTCKPLTATRAIAAITLFFGLRAVSKVFEHDVLLAAPGLNHAATQGPRPFVRALRPALEHQAATTTNPVIKDALTPRLQPLVSDLLFAGLSLWLTFCR